MIFKTITILIIAVLFVYLSQSCLLYCPPIWPDEAYIADISRNLMLKGQIATSLWGEMIPGADKEVLWYPPGIFHLYATYFKAFGVSIESLRLLSSIAGIGVLIIFFTLVRSLSGSFAIASIASLLLALDNFFLRGSRIARPEIFVLFFGMLSLTLFHYSLQKSRLHPKGSLREASVIVGLAGLASALSVLMHLSGLLFAAAILGHIIFLDKSKLLKSKRFFFFVLGFLIGISFWLPKLLSNLPIFWQQISLGSQYRQFSPYFLHILFKTGSIYQIITVFLYMGVSLYFIFYSKIDFKKHLSLYLALILVWVFAIFGKIEWYIVLVIPFVYLAIILSISRHIDKLVSIDTKMSLAVIFLVLSFNLKIYIDSQQYNGDYHQYGAQILENVPKGKTVYISAIPDPYFAFMQRGDNTLFYFPPLPTTRESYLKVLEESDYIVINSNFEAAFVGDTLDKYLESNTKSRIEIEAGGYKATVIKLK